MDAELEVEMRQLPLHQITIKHFYEYNTSAKSDPQPVDEIKYLLPRMLELVADCAEIHHCRQRPDLDRLGNCPSGSFSAEEYSAIHAFALAYFSRFLSCHKWQEGKRNFVTDAFEVLLMFDIGGVNLQALLESWLKNESVSATLYFVNSGFYDFWHMQTIRNAFAKDRTQFQEVLKTWLTNERNRQVFAHRILELDMSAIDQTPFSYYGNQITPKEMAETVFDLISY